MLAVSHTGVVAVSLDTVIQDPFALRCKVTRSDAGDRVLVIDGEIDASNLASFEIFLQEAAEDLRPFIIDMTNVEFACAGAFSLLMALASRTRFFGPGWALVAGRQIVRQAALLGLSEPVVIAESVPDAASRLAL